MSEEPELPNERTARPSALEVKGLYKAFGQVSVLRDISLSLYEGEILGIIGPSGGGKSTLLRCLNLLEVPDQGEIEYTGRLRISARPDSPPTFSSSTTAPAKGLLDPIFELRRTVGFVFQGLNLWEERTVLGNLTLGPRVVSRRERMAAEREALSLCVQYGLESKVHARTWELSGGQRQRVAIVRALLMHPKILLLDEVTSALDPVLTVEIMGAIRQLRDSGLTMVIVTHHLEFANSLCDRLLFLSGGSVAQIDTPKRLRDHPTSAEVATFLDVLRAAR